MKCKLCKKIFKGRSDKLFCSVKCKTTYHHLLAQTTVQATFRIDRILHRNRSILLETLGKSLEYKKVRKEILDSKNFNYTYVTGYHLNSNNKMINYVYDFSWMAFSDYHIAVKRLRFYEPRKINALE